MPRPIEPRRGEIWRVDLEPAIGAEMRKVRPCLVLSRPGVGRLPLRVVVPLTGWQENFAYYPWSTRIEPDVGSGLTKVSAADAFQVRSVSIDRMFTRIGLLPDDVVDQVAAAVALVVGHLTTAQNTET